MNEFPVRTPEQLTVLLQALRKNSSLTQTELASRMGVTQQNMSLLERNAPKMSATRLLELLGALGAELVIRTNPPSASSSPAPASDSPIW